MLSDTINGKKNWSLVVVKIKKINLLISLTLINENQKLKHLKIEVL